MANLAPERIQVPCPSCTFRGPVWLYADGSCVYCGETWDQEAQAQVWDVVPWEWWLEAGMIRHDELPEVIR